MDYVELAVQVLLGRSTIVVVFFERVFRSEFLT